MPTLCQSFVNLKMKEYKFDALIQKNEKMDAAYVEFPFDVQKEFGKKGQIRVKAFFDGIEYRGSLVKMGGNNHIIGLNKQIRNAISKTWGEVVTVLLVEDQEERVVEVPEDLLYALKQNITTEMIFEQLSFTNKKEFVNWVISAKKQETRKARIEKCILLLTSGRRNPGDK